MKKIFVIILSLTLLGSCSSKRYLLTDTNDDKSFLANMLKEEKNKGQISKKPLIVVDGVPYRYGYELKDSPLDFSKSEIKQIEILKREVGIRIYGDIAKDGVVLITTQKHQNQTESIGGKKDGTPFEESKILYLLGDKMITKKEMESLTPDDIGTIDVIKNKEMIKKYTSEDYDGVIIINLKK